MVWTKLIKVRDMNKAMKMRKRTQHVFPDIQKKYIKRLIREFERRGLPWIYDGKPEPKIGKFEERPEMEDTVKNKLLRIEEIKENLLRNDEEIYQYRKEMINTRKYGKFAKVVDELFPSWVSNVRRKNSEGGAARED